MLVHWFAGLRIVILEPVLSVGWFASGGGASDIVTHACSVAVSHRVFPNQQSVLLLRTYIEKHWQQIRVCSFYIWRQIKLQLKCQLFLIQNDFAVLVESQGNKEIASALHTLSQKGRQGKYCSRHPMSSNTEIIAT